jgi:hypothetical protein
MERAETRPASQRNCVPIRDAVVAGESVDLDHLITIGSPGPTEPFDDSQRFGWCNRSLRHAISLLAALYHYERDVCG